MQLRAEHLVLLAVLACVTLLGALNRLSDAELSYIVGAVVLYVTGHAVGAVRTAKFYESHEAQLLEGAKALLTKTANDGGPAPMPQGTGVPPGQPTAPPADAANSDPPGSTP